MGGDGFCSDSHLPPAGCVGGRPGMAENILTQTYEGVDSFLHARVGLRFEHRKMAYRSNKSLTAQVMLF